MHKRNEYIKLFNFLICLRSCLCLDKYYCRVTNCSLNLKELGYKPNKPNIINF